MKCSMNIHRYSRENYSPLNAQSSILHIIHKFLSWISYFVRNQEYLYIFYPRNIHT